MTKWPLFFSACSFILSGCINFLPQPGTAPKRLALLPDWHKCMPHKRLPLEAGAKSLVIAMPRSEEGLNSVRIRVKSVKNGFQWVDRLAGVEWHERLPAMVQRDLIKLFEATGHYRAVGIPEDHFRKDIRVDTDIRAFDLVFEEQNNYAYIGITVRFIDISKRTVLRQEFIEARVPMAKQSLSEASQALNQTYQQVLTQVAVLM